MKISALLLSVCLVSQVYGQTLQELDRKRLRLPNGWSLTSVGKQLTLGDLPLNLVVSHNKKMLAVTNNGQSTQSIELFDVKSERRLDSVAIPKSWYGLAFDDRDQYLYASGGNDNWIVRYKIDRGRLVENDKYVLGKPWPNPVSPGGLAVDGKGGYLYTVGVYDSCLYVMSLQRKNILHKIHLSGVPYTCLLSGDKKRLYVSLWGGQKVLVYNTGTARITGQIPVGSHPNEMCLSKDGRYLYVANADDNSISVISTAASKVVETLNAALYPNAPSGSTSNGVALSDDGKTLYIANADNNCLALFDVSVPEKSRSLGFIPVGWYPTSVKIIGRDIYVTNGKGLSSLANPYGPNPVNTAQNVIYQEGDTTPHKIPVQYIAGMFKGTLSIIKAPSEEQLGIYSRAVYQNTPYSKEKELVTQGQPGNPIPFKVGAASPIKHVFYIIKENRTYDQVLGDVKEGNGDPSLVLFGKKITPNQHKLVQEFVLLDNFYVDAEVSMDGHNWSMGAYANDYLEKTWPTSYGGRGGYYSGEGEMEMGNNKNGFIWNNCARNHVSYRTYGEFMGDEKPNIPALVGHQAPYRSWDLNFRDTARFSQWKKDFDSLVARNAVPGLCTIRFGNDHTQGLRKGAPTPFAQVADNDLAVGLFIDYLSKSPVWKSSVVFILEDDAQNGPDHVDAHRSPLYVAGPYVKRHHVDHTMYSTSGVLRTIELILGLPPMSQYDAAATPLWQSFTADADLSPFDHVPAQVDLDDVNRQESRVARLSAAMNFSKEDAVPDNLFNEVLWQGIKGIAAPAPKRAAFVKAGLVHEDDDD
ncbi:alkaline phosphatase family protein [Compostibacter hankyongensis]|uniref:Bifunctional YncE family protein/alkaline phosphatase family protein n=1 Tax=Compostibacter hankyongensis TaxID=1007089 RepID=A0ABP8G7P4_9BACT